MKSIFNILQIESYRPKWFWFVIILLPMLLVFASNVYLSSHGLVENSQEVKDAGRAPASVLIDVDATYFNLSVPEFAMIFSGGCFVVSVLILFVTVPVYIFSSDINRSNRAGGLTKACMQFLFGSGATILASLSFV